MRLSATTAFRLLSRLVLVTAGLSLAACASSRIPKDAVSHTTPEALSLLTASQRAHGAAAFSVVRDLNAKFSGEWGNFGPRFASKLADQRYRKESEEAIDLVSGMTVQLHNGKGGRKFVLRAPGRASVWYNGQPETDPETVHAAAMVADASKMLLLGPLYFQRAGVTLSVAGTEKVDGADCDQVLAVLRPGFGFAAEDRVLLSIDRQTQRLRRARYTLNGLESTVDKEAEVTFGNWGERAGIIWATQYEERLNKPISLFFHRWTLVDIKANKGFTPRHPEMMGEVMDEVFRRQQ